MNEQLTTIVNDGFYELIPKKKTVRWKLRRSHTKEIVLRHGHIAICDYALGDNFEFEKSLSSWDEMSFRYNRMAGHYVKELHEFRLPRGYDLAMLSRFFPGYPVRFDNDAYPADSPEYSLLTPPKDDTQKAALSFLCSQGDYRKNRHYTTLMLALETGKGKTYLSTAAAAFMHARVVVFVPIGKLLDQWKQSFLDFTSLTEKEVKIIKGSDKCQAILEGKYRDVKVFIFSIDTVVSYANRYGDLEAMEMLMATNAYLKVIDEVHMDIKAVSHIEALSNQRMTIYASASPGRSTSKENWIFNTIYRNVPRFGSEFSTEEEKFLDIMAVYYRYAPTTVEMGLMVNKRTKWLNGMKYEEVLLNAPTELTHDFFDKLRAMLNWSKKLLKDGNKIMILCASRQGTHRMEEIAEEIFPGKCAHYYETGMSRAEKAEALKKTVICATVKSLGTGADIRGIQHVHNISTYANWIGANQTPGRARQLKDGTQVVYVEYVNVGFRKTLNQYEKHKAELKKKTRTGKIITIQ